MIAIICTSLIAILDPRDFPRKNPATTGSWISPHTHGASAKILVYSCCINGSSPNLWTSVFFFFFSILRIRWTGREDFVKFVDRSDKQVENSGNHSTYLRQGRTDSLKLASPRKNSSKTANFLDVSEIFHLGSS
jgi:hypothetical protein